MHTFHPIHSKITPQAMELSPFPSIQSGETAMNVEFSRCFPQPSSFNECACILYAEDLERVCVHAWKINTVQDSVHSW